MTTTTETLDQTSIHSETDVNPILENKEDEEIIAEENPSSATAASPDSIIVDRRDEFFIALAKRTTGDDKNHTFLMLGVIQDGQPTILARVGKTYIKNKLAKDFLKEKNLKTYVALYSSVLFSRTESILQPESLSPSGPISYSAYAINFEHYKQFLRLLSFMKTEPEFNFYQPIEERGNTIVMERTPTTHEDLSNATPLEQSIVERAQYYDRNHNCRESAIELAEYTQGIDHLTDDVSRHFFINLSVTAEFSKGKPREHFYVFPLPPESFEANEAKKIRLTRIFQRMENLLKKDPYGENTIQKFEALKELYYEQAGIPSDDFQEALRSIQRWKENNNNKLIISQLRAQSFWGKLGNCLGINYASSTQKMVDDMENVLSNQLVR
ncbi:hypothetical protein Lnau_0731 [Legionella nautarum]|uniref:Uncharacterized protein n=1 Tax=Legionella nautarum TaxID=45070 RepID=A0A0W0WTT9_9GAMM|nr:hypothetical protein [Legionella nautarum]KTD35747.1 hypothetical protein Lnau_0731 [Legionella nautarum]